MLTWLKLQFENWIKRREEARLYQRERETLRYEEEKQIESKSLICESCENLKMQNAFLQQTINKLHEELFRKSEPVSQPVSTGQVIKPRGLPWQVQRQMVEAESRKQADLLLKKKREEINEIPVNTEELEKEIVEAKKVG